MSPAGEGTEQELRASGSVGAGISQGWGKEGLSFSIFRIPILCPMSVNFPEQVRSPRQRPYLVVCLVAWLLVL